MTKNQIEYLKLRESQRANLAQEDLIRTRDQRSYAIGLGTLAESQRHNMVTESQARASLDETSRHNVAGEKQAQLNLEETTRHNKATEEEMRRHNVVGERYNVDYLKESGRHNRAQEAIGRLQIGASYANISLGYQQLGETKRANQAREYETNRSNVAREEETTRSNIARETETNRSNTSQEAISMFRNRSEAQYKRDLTRQGDQQLTLDTWKTGFKGVDTLLKGAEVLVPLMK